MKNTSKGFTLVELIVVMAVLLFVLGTAVSIFISLVQHQRIILSEQELLNQTSFVLERMSKALRAAKKEDPTTAVCLVDSSGVSYPGYNYLLTRPVKEVYTGIKFINQSDNNVCQEFYLDNSDIANPVLKEIKNNSQPVALTSDRLMINAIRFSINGRNGSTGGITDDNNIQPRVTIFLDIQAKGGSNQSAKKIQTTISQRDLNIE